MVRDLDEKASTHGYAVFVINYPNNHQVLVLWVSIADLERDTEREL